MEREKVIELAIKADDGFQLDPDDMYESLIGIDAVIRFARLVEQETLERAAKKCEEIAYMMGGHVGAMDCALSIRNLKDNHDKE